ncbi:hypothetical protein [Streptacidiphilus carbonis]|uniref:hypothetical protein n=1 Tax=Streptacidiphilus carbonis TaxID=105422 RepID=UPI0006936C8D|nr:hypothetical protein [Streptacidiphilus carbonis]
MSEKAERPAPQPDPIRFFGTGWVTHDTGYWLRRVGVSLGALVAACAGALLLRLAVQGVFVSEAGSLVNALLVVAVAICTCVSAIRTWALLSKGRASLSGWMADEKSVGPMLLIGFVGMLAAYFLRSLLEAPGEAEKRSRYELAVAAHARRRTPAAAGGGGGRRKQR